MIPQSKECQQKHFVDRQQDSTKVYLCVAPDPLNKVEQNISSPLAGRIINDIRHNRESGFLWLCVCLCIVQVERTKQNNLRRDVADKPTYNFPFETDSGMTGRRLRNKSSLSPTFHLPLRLFCSPAHCLSLDLAIIFVLSLSLYKPIA